MSSPAFYLLLVVGWSLVLGTAGAVAAKKERTRKRALREREEQAHREHEEKEQLANAAFAKELRRLLIVYFDHAEATQVRFDLPNESFSHPRLPEAVDLKH
jgi:hypothetical protein